MGTEEFWVPALLAATSAGAQYVNQSQANSRQQSDEVQAIQNQQALRSKANGAVNALTSQVAKDSPNAIAGQATGDYVNELRKNAAGSTQGGSTTSGTQTFGQPVSALPPNSVAGANSRYGSDLATGQQQVQQFGNTYAGEMGQIDAATRQRQNEGLAANTLGTNLNTLALQSYGQNFADQLRARAAGQANPWVSLFSGMLGAGAKNYTPNTPAQTPVNPWLMPGIGGNNQVGNPLLTGPDAPTGGTYG
jgi:hypothetical protein